MNLPPDDPIVALATAPGASALAIVRIDGDGAAGVSASVFKPFGKHDPAEYPRVMTFGRWIDPATEERIDTGLAAYFEGPASFTGNDCVEWFCHGGDAIARRLIDAARAAGARPAEPGEFTRRAYLNGKLDLAQAEAVAELINAQTDAALRLAQGQLSGALSGRIAALRETLIALAAEIEARIDFPEEGLEPAVRERLAGMFESLRTGIAELLETRRRGQLLRSGARVALVGAPNAGKSSLLNALARRERAIVTPHPGTTRDTIECTIDLHGVPLTLVDTAGLRESADPVERLGIERARAEMAAADCVVLVRDLSATAHEDVDPLTGGRAPDIYAWNKVDMVKETDFPEFPPGLHISALRGDGLIELERAIYNFLVGQADAPGEAPTVVLEADSALAVNQRHAALLESAAAALASARAAFDADQSGEFISVDLREALENLSATLGIEVGDAVLDRVFSQFCLGK